MLNQLLKFTLVSSVLLWLRPRWRGLLALSVFVVLVHVLHGEYLGYVELSQDQSLLIPSYVVKWLALLGSVVVYFVFALSGLKAPLPRRQNQQPQQGDPSAPLAGADDGFDFLRQKKQLQSRSEKVLANTSGQDSSHK